MDRDQLKTWIDAGLSLPEIGVLTNRDPSTVGYWVAKYGLQANGKAKYAPRGGLTRAQLEPLVENGATLAEMAKELDRSVSTIRHWMRKHDLKLTRRHRNLEVAQATLAAGGSRFVGVCRHHGETDFLVFTSGRHRCAKCNSRGVTRHRRTRKERLVEIAGGECVRCGFKEHVCALQFHHLDATEKKFQLSNGGAPMSLEKALAELEKCTLLCANCHAMVEAGVITLS